MRTSHAKKLIYDPFRKSLVTAFGCWKWADFFAVEGLKDEVGW